MDGMGAMHFPADYARMDTDVIQATRKGCLWMELYPINWLLRINTNY